MSKIDHPIDVWRLAFWILYFVAITLILMVFIGCIQPSTMYGNVYQCPTNLLTQVQEKLECAK